LKIKTFIELQKMIADLSGLSPRMIDVHRLGDDGDFTATVRFESERASAARANVEAICHRLRLHYRLPGIPGDPDR
jgi:hypothetical protein